MYSKSVLTSLALALGCRGGKAQPPRSVQLAAVIESIHADSAGRAIQGGRVIAPRSLDSLLTELKHAMGGTIWYSWSGGPAHRRAGAAAHASAGIRSSRRAPDRQHHIFSRDPLGRFGRRLANGRCT